MWVYGSGDDVTVKCVAPVAGARGPLCGLRRRILERESRILRDVGERAPGCAPAWLAFDGERLFMARLAGPDLSCLQGELKGNTSLFDGIRHAAQRLHHAGYAHGELRLGNLVRDLGAVRIVDLATAVASRHPAYRLALCYDQLTLLWMKQHLFALPFDEGDLQLLQRHRRVWPWLERLARRVVPFG
jgi:hypothetical protein